MFGGWGLEVPWLGFGVFGAWGLEVQGLGLRVFGLGVYKGLGR